MSGRFMFLIHDEVLTKVAWKMAPVEAKKWRCQKVRFCDKNVDVISLHSNRFLTGSTGDGTKIVSGVAGNAWSQKSQLDKNRTRQKQSSTKHAQSRRRYRKNVIVDSKSSQLTLNLTIVVWRRFRLVSLPFQPKTPPKGDSDFQVPSDKFSVEFRIPTHHLC